MWYFNNMDSIQMQNKRPNTFETPRPSLRRRQSQSYIPIAPTPFNPYAPIGQSQETPEQTAARRQIAAIQRSHRLDDRAGRSRSPTPSFADLLPRQSGRMPSPSPATYFNCEICTLPRPIQVQSVAEGICVYCQQPSQAPNTALELVWCKYSGHTVPRSTMKHPQGIENKQMCNPCHLQRLDQGVDEDEDDIFPSSRRSSISAYVPSRRDSLQLSQTMNLSPSQSQLEGVGSPASPYPDIDNTDPFIDFDMENNDPDAPALSNQDWQYLKDFQKELDKDKYEHCLRCKERWFNTGVQNDVCKKCRTTRDGKKEDDQPFLMSAENHMDFGSAVTHLPVLSQVEKMLIAKVHCFIEVHQIRGEQYKYSGHVCNFLRDIGKVYSKLPLLPKDLEIVLLKPANTAANPGLNRQFKKDYKVRRRAIQLWLEYLKQNHPGYTDLEIDQDALSQLPEDGDVSNEVAQQETAAVDLDANVNLEDLDEEQREIVAIPDLLAEHSEIERMRHDIGVHITQPAFRATPLSEFNRSQPLLSLIFPCLYPRGEAEFVTPREREVDYAVYIEHAMKFHDSRFAQDPRFRYVAMNTLMRMQVNAKSTYYVTKNTKDGHDEGLDLEAIKAAFVNPEDPQAQRILNSIVRHSASLRGTRPFWAGKRANLETYVRSIGSPSTFLTFSAADYHWDSLHKVYPAPAYTLWRNGNPQVRMRITREHLRDNPHIAAYHFHRRFLALMKCIAMPKFAVTDWWNRYEFQGRGSSHNHGFVWCKDVPDLDADNDTSRQEFADFWSNFASAILPLGLDRTLEERTAMSLSPDEDTNTLRQMDLLVDALQKHICTESYCLRIKKGAAADSEKFCRFACNPWPLQEEATLSKDRNPAYWMFIPARNHGRINSYNRLITMAWKANTDVTPCTGSKAVLNYLAKYCTKHEIKSATYQTLVRDLLPYLNSNKPLFSLVSKTMNKLIGERDWSAQEVFHILLNIPLQAGSREVLSLDCRPDQSTEAIDIQDDEIARKGTTKLKKYCSRPVYKDDLTFFAYLTLCDKSFELRPRAKPRFINYFPRYHPLKDVENFARIKLMLHHPFKKIEDLLSADNFQNYASALEYCRRTHTGDKAHEHWDMDGMEELPHIAEDEQEFEEPDLEDDQNDLFWADLAAQRPGRDNAATVFEDPDELGNRPLDREYDWDQFVGKHSDMFYPAWLPDMKEQHPKALEVNYAASDAVDMLAAKQRQVYDLSLDQHTCRCQGDHPQQMLIHVDGKAGTGKSFTIAMISAHLQQRFQDNPVQRVAPTGVAAHGILGRTLHSLFRLPIRSSAMKPLSAQTLRSLQITLKHLTHLVVDEKSMMSLANLFFLDQRLKQIKVNDEPFGGVDISLWGDFFQLPPVLARALYDNSSLKDETSLAGQQLYKLFNRTIELDVNKRQEGQDLEQAKFRTCLEGLRNSHVTKDDWKLLCSRVACTLSAREISTFTNSLRIYGRKVEVNEYNRANMASLNVPVKLIKAKHTGAGADKAPCDAGGNLHAALPLCIGARVMLTENLWTERGLVNGALGVVTSFHWEPDADVSKDIPMVLVRLDEYDGPVLYNDAEYVGTIPITSSTREFEIGKEACTRVQLPLTIAWAITIHKSQGLTKDKIVTNISKKDHVAGLTYVAISRVKTLAGLLIEEPFDYTRFQTTPTKTEIMRLADYARRLPEHVQLEVPALE